MVCIKINLIVARYNDNIIGVNGSLPEKDTNGNTFRLKGELAMFKEVTQRSVLIMGRKTYESVPERFRGFEGRFVLILTRDKNYKPSFKNTALCHDINSAVADAKDIATLNIYNNVFIAGGGEIYKALSNKAENLYITNAFPKVHGDTYFSQFDCGEYTVKKAVYNGENWQTDIYIKK